MNRPRPCRLVPAIAIGFPAVQSRLDSQARQSLAHQNLLAEIHTHLESLSQTHSLTTSLRTLRAQQTAQALTARLAALVARLSALGPNRNASVRRDEDELRVGLEKCQAEVRSLRDRGNELWSGVGALKARKNDFGAAAAGAQGGQEWAVVDEEGLAQVLEVRGNRRLGRRLEIRILSSKWLIGFKRPLWSTDSVESTSWIGSPDQDYRCCSR